MAKTAPLARINAMACTKEQFVGLCERAIIESSETTPTQVVLRTLYEGPTIDLARKANVDHGADIELFDWDDVDLYPGPTEERMDAAFSSAYITFCGIMTAEADEIIAGAGL